MAQRFGIVLKPQDRPVELSPDYQRKLRNEFHARYLERIGATPTPANLAMVRKHMPIDNCKFTTAWKSRGGNADAVYVSPPAAARPGLGARRGPSKPPRRPAQPDELDSSDEIKSEAGTEEVSWPAGAIEEAEYDQETREQVEAAQEEMENNVMDDKAKNVVTTSKMFSKIRNRIKFFRDSDPDPGFSRESDTQLWSILRGKL